MPDSIFKDPRLVAIYDSFDGPRGDLSHYLTIAKELNAKSILDIGSGTGCFALLAAEHGFKVTGVEPALESLNLARRKPNSKKVQWILGDATSLPPMAVDLALMTGNVAQVFLSDPSWEESLVAIRQALRPQGHFVFEVRDPAQRAWLGWTREKTHQRQLIPGVGNVEGWCEVIDVTNELVSFRWTYVFETSGEVVTSDSTLRFRERDAIEKSLENSGYAIREIRGAPDRPQQEFVFIATRN